MLLQGQDNAVGYDGGEDHVLKWSETVKRVTHDLNTHAGRKELRSLLIHAGFKHLVIIYPCYGHY